MKRIASKLAASIMALGFVAVSGAATENTAEIAARNDWLIGKWELTYDADGSPKDWLEFTADGHTVSITPDGRRIPGRYVLKGSKIEVVYSYNGKMIPVVLEVAANKKELLASSQRTQGLSKYRKLPSTEK